MDEKKNYFIRATAGFVNAASYIGGGIANVGKGILHTVGGIVGIGPGADSGAGKIMNGVASVVDGVVTGTLESVAGGETSLEKTDAADLLRRYSAGELREMAEKNPSAFLAILESGLSESSTDEYALRLLDITAPVIKDMPEEKQVKLFNTVILASVPEYVKISAIDRLLEEGIDPNIGPKEVSSGRYYPGHISPFCLVMTHGRSNPELIKLFLDHGADPMVMVEDHNDEKVPLYTCVRTSQNKAVVDEYMKPNVSGTLNQLNQQNITNDKSNDVMPQINENSNSR